MSHRKKRWIIASALGAVCAVALAAQYVVPQGIKMVEVRTKRGSMWPVVGTLNTGDTAEVVREDGDWLIVRVNGKEGTVKKTAFDPPKTKLVAQASGGQASAAEAAAATRGISQETIAYSNEKNLNLEPLERMRANRERVAGEKWVGFASSKNLGPFKK